jgi:hypothetical protein
LQAGYRAGLDREFVVCRFLLVFLFFFPIQTKIARLLELLLASTLTKCPVAVILYQTKSISSGGLHMGLYSKI